VSRSVAPWQDHEEGEEGELRAQLASALCCLAEALLGHAAEAGDAAVAQECERLLLRAAQAQPGSPEPMQVACSGCLRPALARCPCSVGALLSGSHVA
jgi:hypothetical protein